MKMLLCLSLLFISFNGQAFTFNNSVKLTFAQDEVSVNVADGCNNIGIDETELLSIVGDAVDQFWNTVPTSRLKLRKGTVKTVAGAFQTDNICLPSTNCEPNQALAVDNGILITCNNNITNFPNAYILGVTIPNNISGTTINGSLIMINDRGTNQFVNKSRAEKVAIISHEIGHAFGLGHSPVVDSLMYYATVETRRHLGRDDIDGISYLYPKKQPVSCGSIADLSNKKPDWMSGLFIGLFIALAFEMIRKKTSGPKLYT